MTTPEDPLVCRCLARLEELPFVDRAARFLPGRGHGRFPEGYVRLHGPRGRTDLDLRLVRTHLTRTLVDGLLAQAAPDPHRPWILFAPHVGRGLARHLAERGANFVDPVGNCRLQIGREQIAQIEGRPPEKAPPQGRGVGAPGLRVYFALLVRPELLQAPLRTIAHAAGVAPATAAVRLAELRETRLIHVDHRGKRTLAEPLRLLERWLQGYGAVVRPKLMIGRYRLRETAVEAVEEKLTAVLGPAAEDTPTWAFGGGAAAWRLTGFYRGEQIVVHLRQEAPDLPKRLGALRDEEGPLTLLRAPGPVAFAGAEPGTVAPLLVYTELLHLGGKRAAEAATEVRKRYLPHLP